MNELIRVINCKYEDERLALWMKLSLGALWLISIPNGLLFGCKDISYYTALIIMIIFTLINLTIDSKKLHHSLDILWYMLYTIPVLYVFFTASIGYFSFFFVILYSSSIIFIIGMKYSLFINIPLVGLIYYFSRSSIHPFVAKLYGENIALRLIYIYVCFVLVSYMLMYVVQQYWVAKSDRQEILEERINKERRKIANSSMAVMQSMSRALNAKIPGKENHINEVVSLCDAMSKELMLSETDSQTLHSAALLHEIGSIGFSDELLNQDDYTDEESALYNSYVSKGYELISKLQGSEDVATTVLYHRECYDGTGFPEKKKGTDIPYLSRILSLADYAGYQHSKGLTINEVIKLLENNKGIMHDPILSDVMIKILIQ